MSADPLSTQLSPPTRDALEQLLSESVVMNPATQGVARPSLSLTNPLFPAPQNEPAKWPSGAARGIQKVHYTHDAMIDIIIANPAVSQNQIAAHFGYSAGWVSQIIASDAFQARLAERTKDLVDPTIRASVEDHFKAMVLRSLDILKEKLNRTAEAIPDNLALRALELSSRALGYGAREPLVRVDVNVEAHLESLGGGLVQLLNRKKAELESKTIEGEIQK